jgi:hypothetical protein
MRWFRHHLKHSASLALIALAINLALSFGHIHLDDLPGGKAMAGVLVSAITHQANEPTDRHHPAGDPDDFCPISMAGATLSTGVATSPPVILHVEFASVAIDHVLASAPAVLQTQRSAFQSRGPPIS